MLQPDNYLRRRKAQHACHLRNFLIYLNMKICDSAILDKDFLIKDRKDEWTVKIFCDNGTLREQIDGISKEAAFLEENIMASPPGKAYLLQRKKTLLVNSEIERICEEFIELCLNKFKTFSYSVAMNSINTHSDTLNNDTLILNASFMIATGKQTDFLKSVESIRNNECYRWFCIETKESQTTAGLISDDTNNFFR